MTNRSVIEGPLGYLDVSIWINMAANTKLMDLSMPKVSFVNFTASISL